MEIELTIILIYLIIIFTIAFLSKVRGQQDTDNKETIIRNEYLAGQSVSSGESLFSIIATEVSALTFIGIPAFAFNLDYRFIYLYFGAIVGRSVLAVYYLPKFYGKQTTIYEKITSEKNSRIFITTVYMITKLLSIGVRLYSGSILISQYFNVNIYLAITGLSFLTMCYTMVGGLRAVIRTDLLQTLIFITGGIAAHFIIPEIAGQSWSEMISSGYHSKKIIGLDFSYLQVIAVGFLGGIVFDMATHGVDQDFAQRLLATKSLRGAQISIVGSSFLSIFVGLLFLSIGTLLWSYHEVYPIGPGIKSDYVFAVFITTKFPPALKGLMLAGVLAATMSTLDSTINALSSCITADYFPKRSPSNVKKWMKIDAIVITFILVLISFLASQSNEILTLGLKIASWSGGYLLFCLSFAVFKIKKLNLSDYVISYFINLATIYLFHIQLDYPWQWNTAISLFTCAIIFRLIKK